MGSFHQGMQQDGCSSSAQRESPPHGYKRCRGQEPVGYPGPSDRGPGYSDRPTPTSSRAALHETLVIAAKKALQNMERWKHYRPMPIPMPVSVDRPYGGGELLPTSRSDPYPRRSGFLGSQLREVGGHPLSQSCMHDDRGRCVSSDAPGL